MRGLCVVAIAILAFTGTAAAAAADPNKVLRMASNDLTSLDPQQGTDLLSTRVATQIFEALYQFDYLAEPAKVIPNTAEAMPVITDGGKTWTIKLQKGIHFADDPVFKGKKRELTAQDYVYSIERSLDPNLRVGGDASFTDLIVGARPVVDAARKPGARFDYDAPIEGLRAIDRYTLRIKLANPDYTVLERLAGLPAMAVAREAVEAAGDDVMSRPVGTGPYKLKEWKKAARVVLEANPDYRPIRFPESSEPRHRRLVEAMRGKTLPQIGRIEISIIEEAQPQLLEFMQGSLDLLSITGEQVTRVIANGKLKPEFVAKGVQHIKFGAPSLTFTYFNMDDPLVGGYTNAQVALRRAIAMGFNVDELIRVLFAGNALPANQLLPPGVNGHDTSLPPKSLYDPAAARALLDRFNFKDVDGDGFRETPDGKPLTVVRGTLPESWYREADTLWRKNMDAIGIRMQVNQQTFAELLNLSRAGKLPMFNLGVRSLEPSGYQILQTLYGKETLDTNPSGFKRTEYDAAYEEFLRTPAGMARTALARKMSDISQSWMPMILHTYVVGNVIHYPWVLGYWPSQFGGSWKYADIDLAKKKAAAR
ncbi:MAG: ABC transporter substrate-binding protein [Casimicrobiaceae bacterium]